MKMILKGIFLILILFLSGNLSASTGYDVEVQCPLCGTTAKYWQQLSYSIFTYGLDLMPMGAARIPQPIPKCENCGFVFIEDYFTEEEITILRNHIINQKAFSGKENFPMYYYLAYELELLGSKSYDDMAYFYVCSVWEYSIIKMAIDYMRENNIENENSPDFDNNKYMFLMKNAIEKINGLSRDSEQYDNMQLIKLDFLRRTSQFNEAKAVIETIKNNKSFYQEIIVDIIDFQIRLIEEKNTEPHRLDEMKQD